MEDWVYSAHWTSLVRNYRYRFFKSLWGFLNTTLQFLSQILFISIPIITAFSDFFDYKIYYVSYPTSKKLPGRRRTFLRDMTRELTLPMAEERPEKPEVTRNHFTRVAIESVSGKPLSIGKTTFTSAVQRELDDSGKRIVTGCCYVCRQSEDKNRRKTRKSCMTCNQPICDVHEITLTECKKCNERVSCNVALSQRDKSPFPAIIVLAFFTAVK
ncbi:hypothetical protein QAD02_020043 [Eretmocerus hayati]|uniref:Uncharacterized protein n=1 Tax=Eretmocerus hayati TaxID=131215 RepID=A0ACC2PN74_9HYME|nr:hypothetical protein QAD02_020043 [Eretmocerus hayati]